MLQLNLTHPYKTDLNSPALLHLDVQKLSYTHSTRTHWTMSHQACITASFHTRPHQNQHHPSCIASPDHISTKLYSSHYTQPHLLNRTKALHIFTYLSALKQAVPALTNPSSTKMTTPILACYTATQPAKTNMTGIQQSPPHLHCHDTTYRNRMQLNGHHLHYYTSSELVITHPYRTHPACTELTPPYLHWLITPDHIKPHPNST